jgi:hypothetical protein
MDDQDLRKLLEQLHREIDRTPSVDEKGRELLTELQAEIAELLRRSPGEPAQPFPALTRRLEEAIAHLEVSHPTLTSALTQMLTALSNAGI